MSRVVILDEKYRQPDSGREVIERPASVVKGNGGEFP